MRGVRICPVYMCVYMCQNTPLQHKDYFKLKAIEKQQMHEKL